jgi:FYVE/RhoGEF/PH domain-containing protein 5/6
MRVAHIDSVTSSLNTSLHTHAQTLSLLALQKATPNLPFQLISPGRNLIKRGALVQIDRNHGPVDREFLLFSDCLIWLAPADTSTSSWSWSGSGSGASQSSQIAPLARPEMMTRTRSKSDAELATMRTVNDDQDGDESIGPPHRRLLHRRKVGRRRSHVSC